MVVAPITPVRNRSELLGAQDTAMENISAPDRSAKSAYHRTRFYDNVVSGSVGRDGTIEYETDLGPVLDRMLDDVRADRRFDLDDPRDVSDLTAYKRAMFTVMQQNAELLIPRGKAYTGLSQQTGLQTMNGALTDRYCLRNADRYNDQFGLGRVAEGMRTIDLTALAETDHTFADELGRGQQAAQTLIDGLAERTDRDPEDVLELLNRQDADGKVDLIAGWLLDAEPQDLPRAEVERIGAVLNREFAAIQASGGDRSGRALLGRLDHAVKEATKDRQTMSIGLPPPATGTPTVAAPRPPTGARTTDPRGVVRGK